MKKRLETATIQNELKGQSRYFEEQSKRLSKGEPESERMNARSSEQVNKRTEERMNVRTRELANGRTSERPKAKRRIIRHSFQFYADQIDELRKIRAQLELQGTKRELSEMAREAFSAYLKQNRELLNVRTSEQVNGRTSEREKDRLDSQKSL